jgi:hypothetical protein
MLKKKNKKTGFLEIKNIAVHKIVINNNEQFIINQTLSFNVSLYTSSSLFQYYMPYTA